MNFIIDFIRKEEERKQIKVDVYTNGIKYVIENDPLVARTFHSFFKPLNNEQILKLEDDVNHVQKAKYVFPEWYIEFLKTTNGLNIFINSISLFGEQTPIVENKKIGKTESLLERENIGWLAPYNLRYSNSVKFPEEAQNRWLVIGNYKYDGTHIAWDFKTKKIIAMYALPATTSIKKLKKMKECDYESMIICEWDNFESFFVTESERLSKIFESYTDLTEIKNYDAILGKKTLPISHKEHVN